MSAPAEVRLLLTPPQIRVPISRRFWRDVGYETALAGKPSKLYGRQVHSILDLPKAGRFFGMTKGSVALPWRIAAESTVSPGQANEERSG
jgi:hypothetical protein